MFQKVPLPFDPESPRLHPGKCRFCDEPTADLAAKLTAWNADEAQDDARREFMALSKAARYARRREAQEPPWWEQVAP